MVQWILNGAEIDCPSCYQLDNNEIVLINLWHVSRKKRSLVVAITAAALLLPPRP